MLLRQYETRWSWGRGQSVCTIMYHVVLHFINGVLPMFSYTNPFFPIMFDEYHVVLHFVNGFLPMFSYTNPFPL